MNRKIFLYSVTASILATIVFSYAIQPLSVAAWHLTTSASNSVFTWFQNVQVLNAALGKRDWVGPMLMGFLAAAVSAIALCYPTTPLLSRFTRSRLSDEEGGEQRMGLVRRLHLLSAVAGMALAICVDFIALHAFSDLQMNASFGQRLDALAPYVDAQIEKQLRSRWARMETLRDYREINSDMEQLGAKAGIRLPKLLYP